MTKNALITKSRQLVKIILLILYHYITFAHNRCDKLNGNCNNICFGIELAQSSILVL